MLSINRLSARQLTVRKGRTLLTGLAIALGVASIFSMLVMGKSTSVAFERMWRSGFGYVDIKVLLDSGADIKKTARKIADLPGVKGAVIERETMVKGNLGGKKTDLVVQAIDAKSPVSPKLYPLSQGRLPVAENEVALPASLAGSYGTLKVGQAFNVPLSVGDKKLTITGFVKSPQLAGRKMVEVYVSPVFADKYLDQDVPTAMVAIDVVLNKSASQKAIVSKIKKVSGVMQTRSAEDMVNDIRANEKSTKYFFGILGAVALVVGSLLIYTAFAITAVERERELGLMKAIGATRRWPRRLIYREAALLGIMFSALGLLLGFIMSFVMIRFSAGGEFTNGLDPSDLTVSAETLIVSFAAGIGITMFSAFLPALRVGRVHPLATIHPQPVYEQKVSKTRWSGVLLMLAGIALYYRYTVIEQPEDIKFLIAIGGVATAYFGLAIFMPIIIGPIFNLFDKLSVWWFGAAGKLATKNMGRQSVRSARVVTSILIGISLVYVVAIFSEGFINISRKAAKEQVRYELAVASPEGQAPAPLPKKLLDGIKKLDGIDQVTTVRWGDVKVSKIGAGKINNGDSENNENNENDENNRLVSSVLNMAAAKAIDPNVFPKISCLFFPQGEDSSRVWNKLNGKYILVVKNWADMMKIKPGDRVMLWTKGRKPTEFTVITYADAVMLGASRAWGNVYISQSNAERYLNITQDYDMLVKLKDGSNVNSVWVKTQLLLDGTNYQLVGKQEILARAEEQAKNGPQLLFYPLFGIVALISLLGVVNTIAMSVLERRREIGLIKAVGGTRNQVAFMIVLEMVLVSLFGAFLGIAIGTGVAAIFNVSMHKHDIIPSPLTIPVVQMVLLLAAVVFVTLAGSLLPIRMANKIPPVEALRLD